MENCFRIQGDMIQLDIKAVPGASKTEFAGIQDNRLRVRLAAAPQDGRANAELLAFIATALGCHRRDIRLLGGEKSRLKTLALPLERRLQLEQILELVPKRGGLV